MQTFLFDVERQGLAFFDCGGVRLFLAASEPGSTAETGIIYYDVDSVDAAFEALKAKGVEVIHEPQTVYTTDTVEGRMAFLRDLRGQHLRADGRAAARCRLTAALHLMACLPPVHEPGRAQGHGREEPECARHAPREQRLEEDPATMKAATPITSEMPAILR